MSVPKFKLMMKDTDYYGQASATEPSCNARAFALAGVSSAVREQHSRCARNREAYIEYEKYLRSKPFAIFGTQTFRESYKSERILLSTRKLLANIGQSTRTSKFAFIAVERGTENGRWHSHYLVAQINKDFSGNVHFERNCSNKDVQNSIEKLRVIGLERYGWNDVRHITSKAECIEYCAKYVLKSSQADLYDFELF